MNVDAVVLAAGLSTRMGTPKAHLPLGPDTFLTRILSQLHQLSLRSVRVVLQPSEPIMEGVRTVYNPHPGSDALLSLQYALRDLPADSDAVLMWPVDHPLVQAETVRRLLDAFALRPAPIVQPVCGRPGHPVLFASSVYQELLQAPLAEGARHVVRAHRHDRLLVPVDDVHIHVNLDTPETYRQWRIE